MYDILPFFCACLPSVFRLVHHETFPKSDMESFWRMLCIPHCVMLYIAALAARLLSSEVYRTAAVCVESRAVLGSMLTSHCNSRIALLWSPLR